MFPSPKWLLPVAFEKRPLLKGLCLLLLHVDRAGVAILMLNARFEIYQLLQ
jgi:hypothetical protein